jgi:hypothetical protein
MKIIEQVQLGVVEHHLRELGAGNHSDNMQCLARFGYHSIVSLTEDEFFGLVFLQNDEVLSIAPRGFDRTLRAVAQRAIALGQPRMSDNWDLTKNLSRMREKLNNSENLQQPLVICEASVGEQQFGPFYLQDGSHRALARATLMLLNEAAFEQQIAFCSMGRIE